MKVYIKRFYSNVDKYTLGQLWIDGEHICDTLEDPVRELPKTCPDTSRWIGCKCAEKVYGDTAIPAGEYEARVSWSPRFKRYLIEIMMVPHFLGIRIHGGNHKGHTEGCVLVGTWQKGGRLINSQAALSKLHKIVGDKINDGNFDKQSAKFKVIIE